MFTGIEFSAWIKLYPNEFFILGLPVKGVPTLLAPLWPIALAWNYLPSMLIPPGVPGVFTDSVLFCYWKSWNWMSLIFLLGLCCENIALCSSKFLEFSCAYLTLRKPSWLLMIFLLIDVSYWYLYCVWVCFLPLSFEEMTPSKELSIFALYRSSKSRED